MSDDRYPTRFKKGQSGNPKGRPRRKMGPSSPSSPLQVILDLSLTVNGPEGPRALNVEEALLQKTLEDALAGKRQARRKIFNLLLEREKARAKTPKKRAEKHSACRRCENMGHDPRNADEVMRLLGIVIDDPSYVDFETRPGGFPLEEERLLLDTWAAQAALSRRRGAKTLSDREIKEIERCTWRPQDLKWPRSMRDV